MSLAGFFLSCGPICAVDEQERDSLQSEVQQLRTMSPEEVRIRQDQRRKRIEDWRTAIRTFDFSANKFASTDTYSEMKPHLQPDVVRAFEFPFVVEIEAFSRIRGGSRPKYTLLDEVGRIEKEWGLV